MKLKKIISIFTVLVTLISVFCVPTIHSNATTASSGIGLEDGAVYYIMNNGGRLLAPSSDDPDDMVDVITWNIGTWQDAKVKWMVDKQSDGSFKLWSFSGTGRIMRAHTNTGVVEVEYDENDSTVKFDISRVESGTYEGMYTIKCGEYYVSRNGNSDVELTSLTPASYWTFMAVEKRYAGLFTNSPTSSSSPTITSTTFVNSFYNYGYSPYHFEDYAYPENIPRFLTEDDIMIFAGISSYASIDFYKYSLGSFTYKGSFTAEYDSGRSRQNQYYAEDFDSNSLCGSRCIIYLGSYTGDTYMGCNLVDETYDKGAHYVLGIKGIITDAQKCTWLETFYAQIDAGENIADAVEEANSTTSISDNNIYARGDGNQYLKF